MMMTTLGEIQCRVRITFSIYFEALKLGGRKFTTPKIIFNYVNMN